MSDVNVVLVRDLAEELGLVLGALIGSDVAMKPVDRPPSGEWLVPYDVSGRLTGSGAVGLSADDATALAARILGEDAAPDDRAVADALREILGQAASAVARRPAHTGLALSVAVPVQRPEHPPMSSTQAFELTLGDLTVVLGAWVTVEVSPTDAASSSEAEDRPEASAPAVAAEEPEPVPNGVPENLDLILDIELPMSVRFGQTELTLDALTRLGPGSVIDLARSADEPVDVLVNGIPVARGEVVVVGGLYGVRVSAVISPGDRLRTLGR